MTVTLISLNTHILLRLHRKLRKLINAFSKARMLASSGLTWWEKPEYPKETTSDWSSEDRGLDPPVRQHSFVVIGHEIISTAILALPLIQLGQLAVTGERMCTKYWLTRLDLSLPRKSVY